MATPALRKAPSHMMSSPAVRDLREIKPPPTRDPRYQPVTRQQARNFRQRLQDPIFVAFPRDPY